MSALYHVPAGGAARRVQPGQVLDLTGPLLVDGVTVFKRTLYLRIPLEAAADRITLDRAAALALRFEPCTVAVLRGDEHWVRRWVALGGDVSVELAYPAPVVRVDSALYGSVELYRVDGDVASTKPTVTAATDLDLPEPFVALAFKATLHGEKPRLRQAHKSKLLAQRQARHKSLSAAAVGKQELSLTDSAMAQIDQLVEQINGLSTLHLAGTPGSPRLTLRSADGAEILWQWIEPGPHQVAVDYAAETLAQDWQPALGRALGLLDEAASISGAPRPTALVLPLDVVSDGPCRVRVQQASVVSFLERPLLDAPLTVRFGGATEESRAVALTPQAGARQVTLTGHVAVDRGATLPVPEMALSPVGVYLAAGSSALLTVPLDGPLRCAGVAFGWHPLGAQTRLAVRLESGADVSGALAAAGIETESAVAGLLYARWPAVDLQAGAYGVRLSVDEGPGLLAATPGASAVPVVVTGEGGSRPLPLKPALWLLGEELVQPAALALNGTAFAATREASGSLRALLDPVSPATAAAPAWTLEATSAAPLVLQIESARVSYALD